MPHKADAAAACDEVRGDAARAAQRQLRVARRRRNAGRRVDRRRRVPALAARSRVTIRRARLRSCSAPAAPARAVVLALAQAGRDGARSRPAGPKPPPTPPRSRPGSSPSPGRGRPAPRPGRATLIVNATPIGMARAACRRRPALPLERRRSRAGPGRRRPRLPPAAHAAARAGGRGRGRGDRRRGRDARAPGCDRVRAVDGRGRAGRTSCGPRCSPGSGPRDPARCRFLRAGSRSPGPGSTAGCSRADEQGRRPTERARVAARDVRHTVGHGAVRAPVDGRQDRRAPARSGRRRHEAIKAAVFVAGGLCCAVESDDGSGAGVARDDGARGPARRRRLLARAVPDRFVPVHRRRAPAVRRGRHHAARAAVAEIGALLEQWREIEATLPSLDARVRLAPVLRRRRDRADRAGVEPPRRARRHAVGPRARVAARPSDDRGLPDAEGPGRSGRDRGRRRARRRPRCAARTAATPDRRRRPAPKLRSERGRRRVPAAALGARVDDRGEGAVRRRRVTPSPRPSTPSPRPRPPTPGHRRGRRRRRGAGQPHDEDSPAPSPTSSPSRELPDAPQDGRHGALGALDGAPSPDDVPQDRGALLRLFSALKES